jgi:hypothetical protein
MVVLGQIPLSHFIEDLMKMVKKKKAAIKSKSKRGFLDGTIEAVEKKGENSSYAK